MKSLLVMLLASTTLLATAAGAQERAQPAEVKRIPKHTPEWTNPSTGDPGTTDGAAADLQQVVVLCATRPESKAFRQAWQQWLVDHYESGMNVDATIADVLRRADAYRQQNGGKARASKKAKKISRSMHDAAMSVIRNMRG